MFKNPDLYTLTLTCRPDQIEALEALFEEDALALSILAPPRCETAQIDVLLNGEPTTAWVEEKLGAVANAPSYTIAPVGNLDWIKKVAQDFPPLPIARWTVYGAAHRDKITDFSAALQIDATSAFGTGEHPTTRGCLEALDRLLKNETLPQPLSMLDMGCGSGILAMAFAKALTNGHALGVDMDEFSVTIANENAMINGVADRIAFIVGMGYAPQPVAQGAPYDLIMANIFADPLCEMAGDLKNHLKVGGYAILSGLLTTQADAVIAAHLAQGLTLLDHQTLGEWSVLALGRPM